MPELALDIAQIDAFLQRVGSERVAQRVRRDICNARLARVGFQDEPEALAGQTATAVIEEERPLIVDIERTAGIAQADIERIERVAFERDPALAAGAASAAGNPVREIDIFEIERNELADAHAAGVDQLQHRLVAQRFGAMGILTAECAVVGRKPLWDDSEDTTGTGFEDSTSLAMSCKTTVSLPGFSTPLGSATGGKFTGAQITIANGTTTPQQEMILGSYPPDTFLPLSRSVSLRLIYKWKDSALYKHLWQQAAASPQTHVDNEWKPNVVSGAVEITSTAVNNAPVGSHPYRLVFHSDNVDWTISSPMLAPGQMVQAELTGVVKAATTPWWMRLDNSVQGYTFGS